jgi:hypothetical protein
MPCKVMNARLRPGAGVCPPSRATQGSWHNGRDARRPEQVSHDRSLASSAIDRALPLDASGSHAVGVKLVAAFPRGAVASRQRPAEPIGGEGATIHGGTAGREFCDGEQTGSRSGRASAGPRGRPRTLIRRRAAKIRARPPHLLRAPSGERLRAPGFATEQGRPGLARARASTYLHFAHFVTLQVPRARLGRAASCRRRWGRSDFASDSGACGLAPTRVVLCGQRSAGAAPVDAPAVPGKPRQAGTPHDTCLRRVASPGRS